MSYHFEARDAKGQTAISNLGYIIIGDFEHWATWMPPETTPAVHDDTGADLMAIVALIWELNSQKVHLSPDELQKQSQEIAGKMVDGQGNMVSFITSHDLEHSPKLAMVEKPVAEHAKKAHDALAKNDTATAAAEINVAAALYTGYSINQDAPLEEENGAFVAGSHYKPPALTMLEQARLDALADAEKDKTHQEQDKAQSEAAAAAAKQVADLLAKQDALIAKAQDLEKGVQAQPNKSASPDNPPPAGGGAQGAAQTPPISQKQAADLAAAQHDVAEQTRAAATQAQASATGAPDAAKLNDAANKAAAAAKMMEEAARDFAAGKTGDAQAKAGQAKATLQEAGTTLQNSDRDRLATDINNAESKVTDLLDKQQELATDTAKLAKELGDKAPDQRQQRDLQKQAYQQTQLGAAAVEALNNQINDLNQKAAQVGEPEAVRALNDAQHVIKRGQPQNKMAGAVVDLNNGKPTVAADEQKSAADALQKVVDRLQAGSDALAVTREEQLNRANRAAQDAKKSLDELSKTADQHTGAQAQPGTPPPAQDQAAGADAIRTAAYHLGQLTSALDNRQLLSQDQVDQLKQLTLDKGELEKKLAVDPKFVHDTLDIVGRISNKIEGEIEAKSEASKLFSSQREECPPSYRQLVNKYFEALSQVPADPAAKAGQP